MKNLCVNSSYTGKNEKKDAYTLKAVKLLNDRKSVWWLWIYYSSKLEYMISVMSPGATEKLHRFENKSADLEINWRGPRDLFVEGRFFKKYLKIGGFLRAWGKRGFSARRQGQCLKKSFRLLKQNPTHF